MTSFFEVRAPKRLKPMEPQCVVDGSQLRCTVTALKAASSATFCFDPDTALYLGDPAGLMGVALDPGGQRPLSAVFGQPQAWLVVSFVDADLIFTILALPTQSLPGVQGSPLAVLGIDPAKMQPWLQHSNTRVAFDPDHVVLQSNEDPLAQYKLRLVGTSPPTDWRDSTFQSLFPCKMGAASGSVALRLPVHDFSAALRSVAAVGDQVTATLLKAASGPAVLLRLGYADSCGLEVQSALRGVKSGEIYDLCGGGPPGPPGPAPRTDSASPLEAAMAAAEEVEAAATAAAAAVQAAANGERIVEFRFNSKLHAVLFGDKARVAESDDAMLILFHQNMLRIVMTTKTGMVNVYAVGCKEEE